MNQNKNTYDGGEFGALADAGESEGGERLESERERPERLDSEEEEERGAAGVDRRCCVRRVAKDDESGRSSSAMLVDFIVAYFSFIAARGSSAS
jgi:hypothetical protein